MKKHFIKNIKNIFTLLILLSVVMPLSNLRAQTNDSIQLIYPIPQDDGNPMNYENNKSGLYFQEPDNVTHEIIRLTSTLYIRRRRRFRL